MRRPQLALLLSLACAPALADEPPDIEHQAPSCTVPAEPISICASITDDSQVGKASVYFRVERGKYYSYVPMVFGGISYCATLPGARSQKTVVEYYIQAVDDQYQTTRTSTYRLLVKRPGDCEFPAVEKVAARAAAIRVYATDKKQGRTLDGAFGAAGVTFVPLAGK
jgi:hypothetical protein